MHCKAAGRGDCAWNCGEQGFRGASLSVSKGGHLFEAVLETQPLSVLVPEGFEDLPFVLCLHLWVVERGIELRI